MERKLPSFLFISFYIQQYLEMILFQFPFNIKYPFQTLTEANLTTCDEKNLLHQQVFQPCQKFLAQSLFFFTFINFSSILTKFSCGSVECSFELSSEKNFFQVPRIRILLKGFFYKVFRLKLFKWTRRNCLCFCEPAKLPIFFCTKPG